MARLFTKNLANYLGLGTNQIGPLIDGASIVWMSAWVYPLSLTATTFANRMISIPISANNSGLVLCTDAASHLRVLARSTSADAIQSKDSTTAIALNRPNHLLGVINFAAATITPYLNGVAEGGGGVTFGVTAYANGGHTTDQDAIGVNFQLPPPPAATTTQFDGWMADVAIGKTLDMGRYAKDLYGKGIGPQGGADPRTIAPGCVFYMELQGTHSPECDTVHKIKGTITGSLPPIGGWRRRAMYGDLRRTA